MKHRHSTTTRAMLLAIGVVPWACTDAADGDAKQAGELAETTQEDVAAGRQEPPSPAELRAWMESYLPRWRVFFAGEPFLKVGDHRRYWLEPVTVDSECQLVLVPQTRDGFDQGTGDWIHLSARALRDRGMAYFTEKVVDWYSLSLLDLFVIHSLLSQGIDSIPVVPVSMPSDAGDDDTQFRYEEGPGIPGDWGPDNHTVGPGNVWGGGSPPLPPSWAPPRPPPPRGHWGAPRPQHPNPRPKPPLKRSPNGDPGGYSFRDVRNGLKPEDRPEGNYPGWDDPKRSKKDLEVFRCQGHVYVGYRDTCPDYSFFPPDRWIMIIESFLKTPKAPELDKTPEWKLHTFWHDGKKPECLKDAERNATYLCVGASGAGYLACALIPGCWSTILSAPHGVWGVVAGNAIGFYECTRWMKDYAEMNICTR